MMAQIIDRKQLKEEMKDLLSSAQVSPKAMTALYLLISMALNLVGSLMGDGTGLLGVFVSVLADLMNLVLAAGFILYCMAIRRGERAEFLTLFDGFSFVGKVIGLHLLMYLFIALWSMLFVIPGIIAGFRYRFAMYNLYESPGISVMEALNQSKQQTRGYKGQLLMLDFSYVGWVALAILPVIAMEIFEFQANPSVFSDAAAAGGALYAAVSPSWGWSLVTSLWSAAVALFYLPNYQCTELGYFEIAKKTSGVGVEEPGEPENGFWTDGPDDLGGL